jgi:hypothetical protein
MDPARIPLGPRPWLHRLRRGSLRLVRQLHSYYGGVRLPASVHHRLWFLAFPMRTAHCERPDAGPPGSRPRSVRTCQGLRPRRAVWALAILRPSVLPSVSGTTSAPGKRVLSRLNGWPVRSPVNASLMPSRATAHDSGRCGSLLLHRDGLAPSTPCRSPGALRCAPKAERGR